MTTRCASIPGGRVVVCPIHDRSARVTKAVVFSRANIYVWVNTNWLSATQIAHIADRQYDTLPTHMFGIAAVQP